MTMLLFTLGAGLLVTAIGEIGKRRARCEGRRAMYSDLAGAGRATLLVIAIAVLIAVIAYLLGRI